MELMLAEGFSPRQADFVRALRSDESARAAFLADAMAWLRNNAPGPRRTRVPEAMRHALKLRGVE